MVTPSPSQEDFELINHPELSPEDLQKVQAWLQPTEYESSGSEFSRHLSSQAPDTGLWILKTPRFQQWHDSDDYGSLWIKGVPGAGKSVMTAAIIQHLRDVEKVPVLFFFFRNILTANQSPKCLIRDWLSQLLPHSTQLQNALMSRCQIQVDDLPEEQLWKHLLAGLSSLDKAYCVVDALDEMVPAVADIPFLQRLNNLATFRPGAVKVLMTSRPKPYLQTALRDASIVHISLQQDLVGKDIAAFVSHCFSTKIQDPAMRQSLTSLVSAKSCGLFLYARILVDQVIQALPTTKDSDLEILGATLPVGLAEMYDSILTQRAREMGVERAVQILLLQLVTHTSRALRVKELADIIQCAFPVLNHPAKDIIQGSCGPLLEILSDGSVQIIHYSLAEFLLGSDQAHVHAQERVRQFPILHSPAAHKRLAMLSLEYLQSGPLRDESFITMEYLDYLSAKLQHPYLEYAVTNWAYHASHYDIADEGFFQAVSGFADPHRLDFRTWAAAAFTPKLLYLEEEPWRNSRWPRSTKNRNPLYRISERGPSLLHIAAFAGMTKYAQAILSQGEEVFLQKPSTSTPLYWAMTRNHIKMTSLILEQPVQPDMSDHYIATPLTQAIRSSQAEIVQMVLQTVIRSTEPKLRLDSEEIESYARFAVRRTLHEIMAVLVPLMDQDTLARWLCDRSNDFEAIRTILEHSTISPNLIQYGNTPLCIAVESGNSQTVELLLAKGADPNFKPKLENHYPKHPRGVTTQPADLIVLRKQPLNVLAKNWSTENTGESVSMLNLLLGAGTDLEQRDQKGKTPLMNAVHLYKPLHTTAIRRLLQVGARVSTTDPEGNPFLHRLLDRKLCIEALELALQHGADIAERGRNGNTVWHTLLSSRYYLHDSPNTIDEVVSFLIEKGAGPLCSIANDAGSTALELAATADCSLSTFNFLLEACPGENGMRQCLRNLCKSNSADLGSRFQALIAAGCPLQELDQLLLSNITEDNALPHLLSAGARLNAVDSQGRTALHYCIATRWATHRLPELVNQGLDPCRPDHQGNTILHEAASYYCRSKRSIELIEMILSYGVPVNARNQQGQTALHVYLGAQPPKTHGGRQTTKSFLTLLLESQREVELDIQDHDGFTPLHLAAMRSEIYAGELLAKGANATLLTSGGDSVLHLACRSRMSNVVGLLLHHTKGSGRNDPNSSGRTPLHLACRSGQFESVHYLLRYGADPNIADGKGRTPIHACAEFAIEEKLWFLHEHADDEIPDLPDRLRFRARRQPRITDYLWNTDRYKAAEDKRQLPPTNVREIIDMLIDAGAAPFAQDASEDTPLELAIAYGCREMVEALQFTAGEVQRLKGWNTHCARLETVATLSHAPGTVLAGVEQVVSEELLGNPAKFIRLLDHHTMDFILQNDGKIAGQEEKDFPDKSLIHRVARDGRVEIMRRIKDLAKGYDDLVFHAEAKCYNELLGFYPVLHSACWREMSNLYMLEVLVEQCGVNVNAQPLHKHEGNTGPGESALHVLARSYYFWQLDAIEYLVKKGAVVDVRNEKGETPLHIACTGCRIDLVTQGGESPFTFRDRGFWSAACVERLLDLGADPNALTKDGVSPLCIASPSPETVRLLLKRGASLSSGPRHPLLGAINSLNVETLKTLLDAGVSPNIVFQIEHRGQIGCLFRELTQGEKLATSPLLWASMLELHGTERVRTLIMPIVRLLIERGADLFAPHNDAATLVHFVFQHAKYWVIQAFLEYADRIDFNRRDQRGRTVLHAACNWHHAPEDDRYPHRRLNVDAPVIQLLDLPVDITTVDNDSRTILHHIISCEAINLHTEATLRLLDHEPCRQLVNQKDKDGFTPLHCALKLLYPAVCEQLISLGGDLLEPDPTGASALHQIASQVLELHGTSRYDREWNPRHRLVGYTEGAFRVWRKYLELGGDINVRDPDGNPPLFAYLSARHQSGGPPSPDWSGIDPPEGMDDAHNAAYAELFSMADVFARNRNGDTALHVIARRPFRNKTHTAMLYEFMLDKGVDPLAENNQGQSSVDAAAAFDQTEILEVFKKREL